jgi:hypothetical protein
LIQDAIERAGMSTISLSVRPEVSVYMRLPRAIYVRFPTGNAFGEAWVRTLAEEERSRPQPDPKFLSAVGVQVRYAGSFVDLLQRAAFDDFLHFSDRVIRLKHWQEGTFI